MTIEVFDLDYTPIGQVQAVESVSWSREMFTPGEFSITCAGTLNPLFAVGRVVMIRGVGERAGFIEQISVTHDGEGIKTVIRGHDVLSILDRRVLSTPWGYGGTPSDAIEQIITRELRGLSVSCSIDPVSAEAVFNYDAGASLLSVVTDIATHYDIILSYILIPSAGVEIIGSTASMIVPGELSVENGTLLSAEYDVSTSTYKNAVYAISSDKENPVLVETVDPPSAVSGDARREYWQAMDVTEDVTGVIPAPTEYFPGSVSVSTVSGYTDFDFDGTDYKAFSSPTQTLKRYRAHIVLSMDRPAKFGLHYNFGVNHWYDETNSNWDFGIGHLDQDLSIPGHVVLSSSAMLCGMAVGSDDPIEGVLVYDVPAGEHYIDIYFAAWDTYIDTSLTFRQTATVNDIIAHSLGQRSKALLAELKQVDALTGRINPYSRSMKYGTDYDLGQYITIKSKAFGVSSVAQITRVVETTDSGGFNADVTFGKYYMTQRKTYDLGV